MDGGKTILSFWDILTFQGKCLLNFRGVHHFDFPNIFRVRSFVIGAQKHQPGPPNQRRVHRWYRKDDWCPTVMNHVLHPLEVELSTLEETKINKKKKQAPNPKKGGNNDEIARKAWRFLGIHEYEEWKVVPKIPW